MKKIFVLGIVALAVLCLGLSACAPKGGTLKLFNDSDYTRNFQIRFDGKAQTVKDGAYLIEPEQTMKAVSEEDTSYTVYISSTWIGDGAKPAAKGSLSGGETVTLNVSEIYTAP